MSSWFVGVELQKRHFQDKPIFCELANRSFEPFSGGLKQIQPWCRWRGISTYLDCLAFADSAAAGLPTGNRLDLENVTPGRFYSAGIVFFAQAMIDNIADWLSDALPLQIKGGDRNFRNTQFKRELRNRFVPAELFLQSNQAFIDEVNHYRQVWIHTLAGGALPVADGNPFLNPESARKFLGVPIDPAINPDEENYRKRAEECASKNNGRYLYPLPEFTNSMFNGASSLYLDSLRFALDNTK